MTLQAIARIDVWLSHNRSNYYAQLQAGATDCELDALEVKLSLKLPGPFRELYKWRNGQPETCYEAIQFNRSFMSLDEIQSAKEMLDGMIGFDFEDPRHWRRGWIPFLHNGACSHLCIDLTAEDGGQPGQLIAFWKADSDRPIESPSLDAWLSDLAASMESGTLEFC
jgi:cell wall assembly regulator SMI1